MALPRITPERTVDPAELGKLYITFHLCKLKWDNGSMQPFCACESFRASETAALPSIAKQNLSPNDRKVE